MAISSSTFPKKINRYKLSTLSVLLLFIFCIFLFNKRALDRTLFQNTDRIPQTPAASILSPPRSAEFLEKLGDLRDPASSLSNVDDNVASSSKLSEPESQEEGKEEHVSSDSDFDDKTSRENNEPFASTDSESRDNLGEKNGEPDSPNEENVSSLLSEEEGKEERVSLTPNLDEETTLDIEKPNISSDSESLDDLGQSNGEPISSNEEKVVSVSSESDIDEKSREKSEYIGVKEKSQDDFGERADDPTSSSVPISSNSDVDENTEEKPEDIEVEDKSIEETPSSDAKVGGVIDNAIVEKLRHCDIYKGTWVKDDDYPLYKPGTCPYVDDGFACQGNGRPDSGYTQWRWKPDECDLPRFSTLNFVF